MPLCLQARISNRVQKQQGCAASTNTILSSQSNAVAERIPSSRGRPLERRERGDVWRCCWSIDILRGRELRSVLRTTSAVIKAFVCESFRFADRKREKAGAEPEIILVFVSQSKLVALLQTMEGCAWLYLLCLQLWKGNTVKSRSLPHDAPGSRRVSVAVSSNRRLCL